MAEQQTPRRARHLMDPSQPRVATSAADLARLQRVQRTVMSVLAFTTIAHLSIGLVLGALFLEEAYTVGRVGLCVLGGITGVLGIAATRAIHRRNPVSGWLALGLLPGAVGIVLALDGLVL